VHPAFAGHPTQNLEKIDGWCSFKTRLLKLYAHKNNDVKTVSYSLVTDQEKTDMKKPEYPAGYPLAGTYFSPIITVYHAMDRQSLWPRYTTAVASIREYYVEPRYGIRGVKWSKFPPKNYCAMKSGNLSIL